MNKDQSLYALASSPESILSKFVSIPPMWGNNRMMNLDEMLVQTRLMNYRLSEISQEVNEDFKDATILIFDNDPQLIVSSQFV